MKSATYTVLSGAPTQENARRTYGFNQWKVQQNLSDTNIVCFERGLGWIIYTLSVFTSALIITFDVLLLTRIMDKNATDASVSALSIEDGANAWAVAMISIMIGMDVLVVTTQAFDLFAYHFEMWPLTMFTWFGQLNGTGISSAVLGMVLYYPFADREQRDTTLTFAMLSLALHAIFLSAQFSVTLEYIMKKIKAIPTPQA